MALKPSTIKIANRLKAYQVVWRGEAESNIHNATSKKINEEVSNMEWHTRIKDILDRKNELLCT